jgi:hypothetical protein
MVKGYVFGNKIIKQGNSLCVRIPSYIAKQAKLKVGKNIAIILETNQVFDEGYSSYLFMNISTKFKKLKKYSEDKIRVFILLHFKYLKEATDEDKKTKEQFYKKLRREYSDKLVDEYIDWTKVIQDAYIYSKDGSFIVKPKYLEE